MNTPHLLRTDWSALQTPSCLLAESPRFAHNYWFWVDIDGKAMHRCVSVDWLANPTAHIESIELPDTVGCVLPKQTPHEFGLFGRQGIYDLHWEPGCPESLKKTQDVLFDADHYRFNDGRADIKGRAWVSTLSDARQPGAMLFRIDPTTTKICLKDLIVGNGLAFSPDQNTLYFADTRQRSIWRFDFDPTEGLISHQELMAEYKTDAARPDGATVAQDGSYIVAVFEGYRLDRYAADGKLIEEIPVPVARPTMPCLGGPSLNQIIVTCAPSTENLPNHDGFEQVCVIGAESHMSGIPENLAA